MLTGTTRGGTADAEAICEHRNLLNRRAFATFCSLALMSSCSNRKPVSPMEEIAHDVHSYGNPAEARVRHISLDLTVAFDEHSVKGSVVLTGEKLPNAKQII